MENVKDIKAWLDELDDEEFVGTDEGGNTLLVVTADEKRRRYPYYEIGGIPEEVEHGPIQGAPEGELGEIEDVYAVTNAVMDRVQALDGEAVAKLARECLDVDIEYVGDSLFRIRKNKR